MDIQLTNFRGFKSSEFIPIRPITLLVGENSTGKTSFQAAARYLTTSFKSFESPQASFNTAPFNLGGYEDIAYNRVGRRGGRAPSFSISRRISDSEINNSRSAPWRRDPPIPSHTTHLTFADWMGQPGLHSFGLETRDRQIGINIANGTMRLENKSNNTSTTLHFNEKIKSQFDQVRGMPRLLSIIVSPLRFISKTRVEPTDRQELFDEPFLENKDLLSSFSDMFSWMDDIFDSNDRFQIVAISPIRTEPRRVYEFSESTLSPTGAHVPGQLARQKIQNPDAWKRSREYLVEFGKNAGLYTNLDIRKLGRSPNDPFQILITLAGNKRNIVDVGYGVSQVIPLLYEMAETRYKKLIMMQQPEVHLHPRAQAELGSLVVKSYQNSGHNFIVETHSDFVLDRIRTEIRNKRVPSSDVSLLYFERKPNNIQVHEIHFDEHANLINPPKSYRSFFLQEEKTFLGI